jgi:hypothetical protein
MNDTAFQFPTIDVLAASCAIYRTTGEYVSNASALKSMQTPGRQITGTPQLLKYAMCPRIAPSYYLPITITEADIAAADTIIKYFHRLTFNVLANSINEFEQKILEIIDKPTVSLQNFAMIACMPASYQRHSERYSRNRLINETTGKLYETIGESITTFCYVVDTRSFKLSNSIPDIFFSHTAITTDGYLIDFLNKALLGEIGSSIRIRARVKEHILHYETFKPLTRLNYVKVI